MLLRIGSSAAAAAGASEAVSTTSAAFAVSAASAASDFPAATASVAAAKAVAVSTAAAASAVSASADAASAAAVSAAASAAGTTAGTAASSTAGTAAVAAAAAAAAVASSSAFSADAASSVWEQTLATLSEDDIARAEMGYLYPQYNGAAPHRSGRIPLTRHHVTAVLNSSVVVEVYRGADRNVETDTLVGRASFGAETWDGERLVGGESSMARVLAYPGGVSVELPLEEAVTAAAAEPNENPATPSPYRHRELP